MTVSVGANTLEREEESRMRRVGGSDNEIESERKRERGDNKIQHLFLLFLTKALTNSTLQNMPTHDQQSVKFIFEIIHAYIFIHVNDLCYIIIHLYVLKRGHLEVRMLLK